MKSVRVRMYRLGLGDCFLLSFPGERGEAHVLIDCGVLKGPKDSSDRIHRVANSILETTQGRLDALVVTHRHWDHVSGFLQAQSVFDRLQIQEVWLAWTEDPTDTLARELSLRKSMATSAIRQAALRLGAASDHHGNQTARQLSNLLGLDGELEVGSRQTTAKAMEWVTSRKGARVRYLTSRSTPMESPAFENVRIHVLGPPRESKVLRTSDPATRDREACGLSGISGADTGFLAAAGAAVEDLADRSQRDGQPFEKWFRMSDLEIWDDPFFDKFYGGGVKAEDAQSWRRIESDWLGAAGRLALQLDSHTKRASLVLAFELLPSGRVLLFPGDAQVGNWLSRGQDSQRIDAMVPSDITIFDLLARTALYKVAHHGSHSFSLREHGLELMSSPGLAAMLPVDRKTAKQLGWQMPCPKLYRRLLEKTNGRILDSEFGVSDTPPAGANEEEWRDFLSRTEVRPDWVDYLVAT